jgi:hypothetical protein
MGHRNQQNADGGSGGEIRLDSLFAQRTFNNDWTSILGQHFFTWDDLSSFLGMSTLLSGVQIMLCGVYYIGIGWTGNK